MKCFILYVFCKQLIFASIIMNLHTGGFFSCIINDSNHMDKLVIHLLSLEEVRKHESFLLTYVSPQRKDKSLEYRFEENRYQSLGAGYLLKKYTKGEDTFSYNKYHKPEGEEEYFNIAHSYNYVAFIKADVPCGIDIEKIKEAKEKLIKYAFASQDQKLIKTNDDFFKYWTLKEAIGKAHGNGLIDESIQDVPAKEGRVQYKNKCYFTKAFKLDDYYLSIALEDKLPEDIILQEEIILED